MFTRKPLIFSFALRMAPTFFLTARQVNEKCFIISGVALLKKEACELVEAGFKYICEMDGTKISRKIK